jgi:hypothetical protein
MQHTSTNGTEQRTLGETDDTLMANNQAGSQQVTSQGHFMLWAGVCPLLARIPY